MKFKITPKLLTGIKIGNFCDRDFLACPDRGASAAAGGGRHD